MSIESILHQIQHVSKYMCVCVLFFWKAHCQTAATTYASDSKHSAFPHNPRAAKKPRILGATPESQCSWSRCSSQHKTLRKPDTEKSECSEKKEPAKKPRILAATPESQCSSSRCSSQHKTLRKHDSEKPECSENNKNCFEKILM